MVHIGKPLAHKWVDSETAVPTGDRLEIALGPGPLVLRWDRSLRIAPEAT